MSQKQDLGPLLDVRQNHLSFLLSTSDSLDTKNLALLAINVAVLLFIAQLDDGTALPLLLTILGIFIVSLLINILSITPREYIGASVDIDEHPEYLSMAEDDLILQLLSDTQYAITHNRKINSTKLYLCLASLLLNTIGTLLLVWAIL